MPVVERSGESLRLERIGRELATVEPGGALRLLVAAKAGVVVFLLHAAAQHGEAPTSYWPSLSVEVPEGEGFVCREGLRQRLYLDLANAFAREIHDRADLLERRAIALGDIDCA